MNFKNLSIILALLSFELKVFSIPVNDIALKTELSVVEISDSEISSLELSATEISDTEVVNDELVTEEPNDDSDSEVETTEVPSDSVDDGKETSDLPCTDLQTCIDWMKENKEVLESIGYNLKDEIFDYFLLQYQDEEKVKNLKKNFDAVDYGIKVDVDGRKMSVNIMGEEHNETIVLLPAYGVLSPVIFYKNLTEKLSNDFKVVTIEPFGYGVSDLTDEERTAENIVSEIHTCLQELGIDQFYFMGHSIGGIYSIIYDNTFEKEVLGFIGLDNTPSNYDINNYTAYPEKVVTFTKILDKYHLWGLLPEDDKKKFTGVEIEQQYQDYSDEDLEDLLNVYSYRFVNPTIVDEYNHVNDNIVSTHGMYFHCPLLMFITDETSSLILEWESLHKNMINDNPNEKIIDKSEVIHLKNTTHLFIHTQEKDRIYTDIKKWIN